MKRSRLLLPVLAALLLCGSALALRVPQGVSRAELALPDGFVVRAELALTPEAQAKGLMFREQLPQNEGMLFVFGGMETRTFWMKNTFVVLDIVFLDADLKVRKVFHRVPRSRADQPDSEITKVTASAACVLELAAGTARAHGVAPGAKLRVSFPAAARRK